MEAKKDVNVFNVWSKFNFTGESTPSVFNYLQKQIEPLEQKTRGKLTMEYNFDDGLTSVYIVAPKLGGYRKKFLLIKEESDKNFPVSIWSTITNELNNTIMSLYQMASDNC